MPPASPPGVDAYVPSPDGIWPGWMSPSMSRMGLGRPLVSAAVATQPTHTALHLRSHPISRENEPLKVEKSIQQANKR